MIADLLVYFRIFTIFSIAISGVCQAFPPAHFAYVGYNLHHTIVRNIPVKPFVLFVCSSVCAIICATLEGLLFTSHGNKTVSWRVKGVVILSHVCTCANTIITTKTNHFPRKVRIQRMFIYWSVTRRHPWIGFVASTKRGLTKTQHTYHRNSVEAFLKPD